MGGQSRNVAVRVLAIDRPAVTAPAGDHAVAAVASRQHGVVSHRQLVEAGISPRAIEGRVRSGRLHRLHRGVYAVGHVANAPLAVAAAALLACGQGAILSHRSAAAAWGSLTDRPRRSR
jgi:predicted transcriptional regulator of viral defense system